MRLIAVGSETFASNLRTCIAGIAQLHGQKAELECTDRYESLKLDTPANVCFLVETHEDPEANANMFRHILNLCCGHRDSIIAVVDKADAKKILFLYGQGINQTLEKSLLTSPHESSRLQQMLQAALAFKPEILAVQDYAMKTKQFKDTHTLHHAVSKLKSSLSQNPNMLGLLASALEDAGEFQQAAHMYANALRFRPFDLPNRYGLLRCHLIMGSAESENLLISKVRIGVENFSSLDLLTEATRALELKDHVVQTAILQMAEHQSKFFGMEVVAELRFLVDMNTLDHQSFMQRIRTLSHLQNIVAIRCNGRAISLSQSGKGEEALQIFDATYALVNPALRYKVSMNAALAALRLGSADRGRRYLKMCRADYGAELPKFSEIEANLNLLEKQAAKENAA